MAMSDLVSNFGTTGPVSGKGRAPVSPPVSGNAGPYGGWMGGQSLGLQSPVNPGPMAPSAPLPSPINPGPMTPQISSPVNPGPIAPTPQLPSPVNPGPMAPSSPIRPPVVSGPGPYGGIMGGQSPMSPMGQMASQNGRPTDYNSWLSQFQGQQTPKNLASALRLYGR
jgi:hypothetical protein